MIVLLLLMIICYCNKTNFSSSISEVIRLVWFFFMIRFHKYKKALKGIKDTKKHFYHRNFFRKEANKLLFSTQMFFKLDKSYVNKF